MEFEVQAYDEYVPRTEIMRVVTNMSSPTMTRSPKMTKNTPKQRQMSKVNPIAIEDFASASINQSGCPTPIMQFLEVCVTVRTDTGAG